MAEPQASLQERQSSLFTWSTRDILASTVVGVASGLLLTVSTPLTLLMGPVGWVWSAWWTIGPLFMAYVLRRPGAVFVTGVLSELVQWPLSQGGSIGGLIRGILFGLVVELAVGLITRYRHFSLMRMLLVGLLSGLFIFAASGAMAPGLWGYNIFTTYSPPILAIIVASLVIGGMVCGGIAKGLADAVARTGVLSHTALSRASGREEV